MALGAGTSIEATTLAEVMAGVIASGALVATTRTEEPGTVGDRC
jgi:hypothetical protein